MIRREDGVAIVTINNVRRRNALTPELADALVDALDEVDLDDTIGALVVMGSGGTFCSGADLSSIESLTADPLSAQASEALERIYRPFTRFGEVRVPTIAAVRGSAVGAGLNLALAADVRIVAHDARIISGFSKIGLHPGGGHFQLLVKASSREVAAALGIFSQELNGRRAAELGFAWESVDDDEVESRAMELARVAGADPVLSRKEIQSLRETNPSIVPWTAALQAERASQVWSFRRAANRQFGS
ncbi:MAG TPA: enoyl-CoA hydratase/isomerase family protein [Acidimicrobiales bacterium]